MGCDDRAVRAAGERDRDERTSHGGQSSGAPRRRPDRRPPVAGRAHRERVARWRGAGTLRAVETATDDGRRPGILHRILGDVPRSLGAVLLGTFTLRFSTGLTGTLLIYYLADLPAHGGPSVDAVALGAMTAAFYASELLLATPFGCCPTAGVTTGSCSSARSSGSPR